MVESSAFQALAQFAIAQAGFASVVVVLWRGRDQLHPADGYRIFTALVPSITGGFLALLPIGLDLIGMPEARIWLLLSWVFAGVVVFFYFQAIRRLRRLPTEARELISNRIVFLNSALLGLVVTACLLNSMSNLLGPPRGGFYFFGVVAALFVGAVTFIRLVFVRPAV